MLLGMYDLYPRLHVGCNDSNHKIDAKRCSRYTFLFFEPA